MTRKRIVKGAIIYLDDFKEEETEFLVSYRCGEIYFGIRNSGQVWSIKATDIKDLVNKAIEEEESDYKEWVKEKE